MLKLAVIFLIAGLGTSGAPFRLGVPPDLWLVTLSAPRP